MKINKANLVMRRPRFGTTKSWIPEEALLERKHNLINAKTILSTKLITVKHLCLVGIFSSPEPLAHGDLL